MNCFLCTAIGEKNEGEPFGGAMVLCPEHRASCKERAAKPQPPVVVRWPLSAEEQYERHAAAAVLGLK